MENLLEKLYKLQAQILCVTEEFQGVKNMYREDAAVCDSTVDALLSGAFNLKTILSKYSSPSEEVQIKVELEALDEVISGSNPLGVGDTTDKDSDCADGFMDDDPEPEAKIKSEVSPPAEVLAQKQIDIEECKLLIKPDVCDACGEHFSTGPHNCNCNGGKSTKPKKKKLKRASTERKKRVSKKTNGKTKFESSYSCELCGRILKTRRGLKYHQSKHTGLYRFKCPVCDKGFNRKLLYRIHLNAHNGIKMYVCERCGKALTHSGSLSQHKKYCQVAEEDKEKFSCGLCDKFYFRRKSLQDHIEQIHENKYVYQCDNCGEMTTSRKSRELHSGGKCRAAKNKIEIDLENLPDDGKVRCRLCGKAFTRKDSLREHVEAVHEKTRKHNCEACGKLFKTRASKSNHKRWYCNVLRGIGGLCSKPKGAKALPDPAVVQSAEPMHMQSPETSIVHPMQSAERAIVHRMQSPERAFVHPMQSPERALIHPMRSPEQTIAHSMQVPEQAIVHSSYL